MGDLNRNQRLIKESMEKLAKGEKPILMPRPIARKIRTSKEVCHG